VKQLVTLVLASVLGAGCAAGGTPGGSAAATSLEQASPEAVATVAPEAPSPVATPAPIASPVPAGRWVSVPGSELVGAFPMAARLTDGRVLLIDDPQARSCIPPGSEPDGLPPVVYDPSLGTITEVGSPGSPGRWPELAVLHDGRVIVAGGMGSGATPRPETRIWDPATGAWTDGPPMSIGRNSFGLAALPDGRVLAVGGEVAAGPGDGAGAAPGYGSSAEILEPSTGTWSAAAPIPWRELPPVLVVLEGGGVLALPAKVEEEQLGDPMLYDPSTGQWTVAPLPDGMDIGTTAVALPDGSALVRASARDFVRFDPASGWHHAGQLLRDRFAPAIAGLGDGRVLVVGGEGVDADNNAVLLDTAEIFDPATGASTEIAPMPVGRSLAVAVPLADESILVLGGNGNVGLQEEFVNSQPCVIASARAVRWVP
jgi:hypothetical protein